MDADYTFYVKSIETHERAFLPLNISAVSSVAGVIAWTTQKIIMQNLGFELLHFFYLLRKFFKTKLYLFYRIF